MEYYDVWQKDASPFPPYLGLVAQDVKASDGEEACKIIAQERDIPVEKLRAFTASNPGYRVEYK